MKGIARGLVRSNVHVTSCLGLLLAFGPAAARGPVLAQEGGARQVSAIGSLSAPGADGVRSMQQEERVEQAADRGREGACDVERIPSAGDFGSGAGYQRYFWSGSRSLDEVITETLNEFNRRYELASRPGEFVCRSSFRELGTFGKGDSTTGYVALQVSFPLDQGPKTAFYVYYLACEKRTASKEPRLLKTEEVREAAEGFREEYIARVSSKAEEEESEAEDD